MTCSTSTSYLQKARTALQDTVPTSCFSHVFANCFEPQSRTVSFRSDKAKPLFLDAALSSRCRWGKGRIRIRDFAIRSIPSAELDLEGDSSCEAQAVSITNQGTKLGSSCSSGVATRLVTADVQTLIGAHSKGEDRLDESAVSHPPCPTWFGEYYYVKRLEGCRCLWVGELMLQIRCDEDFGWHGS